MIIYTETSENEEWYVHFSSKKEEDRIANEYGESVIDVMKNWIWSRNGMTEIQHIYVFNIEVLIKLELKKIFKKL